MKKLLLMIITPLAVCLSACATPTTRFPQAAAVDLDGGVTRAHFLARALRVSYPIMLGAADGCQAKKLIHGTFLTSTSFSDPADNAVATKAFGLGAIPKIVALHEASLWYVGGAREGDLLISGSPDSIVVRGQDGKEKIIPNRKPEPSCDVPIKIIQGESPNAYADKGTIYINEGMMRFASDEELAQVISHELAHVLMEHSDAKDWNSFLGTITGVTLDVFAAALGVNTQGAWTRVGAEAGRGYASQDWEREADYVGLYLMAKGGYDITRAPDFWKRMAKLYPQSAEPSLVSTHPSSAERYRSMGIAVAEISKKISLGQPLEPEKKK